MLVEGQAYFLESPQNAHSVVDLRSFQHTKDFGALIGLDQVVGYNALVAAHTLAVVVELAQGEVVHAVLDNLVL